MCGLFGVVGSSLTNKSFKPFSDGLLAASCRGLDSTGVGIVGIKHAKKQQVSTEFMKNNTKAIDFLAEEEYYKWIKKFKQPIVIMGHARSATVGTISADNAHPFLKDNILLCHNGTLTNKWELCSKSSVDSEAIAEFLSKNTLQETVDKMEGAYCLTYYDVKNLEFNIIRNEKRPLFIAKAVDGEEYYYASEESMIEYVCRSNGIPVGEITSLPVHTLMKFKLGNNSITVTKEEVKPKERPFAWGSGQKAHGYRDYNSGGGGSTYIVPTDKGPLGDGSSALKKENLEILKRVSVYLDHFEPYSRSKHHGKAEGWLCENDLYWAVASNGYNTWQDGANGEFRPGYYTGMIGSCRWDSTEKTYWVTISSLLWDEENNKSEVKADKEYHGPQGAKTLDAREYLSLVKNGCWFCNRSLGTKEHDELVWVYEGGKNTPVCRSCALTLSIKQGDRMIENDDYNQDYMRMYN